MISSPGIGLQQEAIFTLTLSIPATVTSELPSIILEITFLALTISSSLLKITLTTVPGAYLPLPISK